MSQITPTACQMCKAHAMIPSPTKSGGGSVYMVCPNCDNVDGTMPEPEPEEGSDV